jgi:hypothetical protein
MGKNVIYVLAAVSAAVMAGLCYLTYEVGVLLKPGQPIGYYVGLAIGGLIMPVIFAAIAGAIKRSFSEDKSYDWQMFHIFLISFCLLSVLGKYGQLKMEEEKAGKPKMMYDFRLHDLRFANGFLIT